MDKWNRLTNEASRVGGTNKGKGRDQLNNTYAWPMDTDNNWGGLKWVGAKQRWAKGENRGDLQQ